MSLWDYFIWFLRRPQIDLRPYRPSQKSYKVVSQTHFFEVLWCQIPKIVKIDSFLQYRIFGRFGREKLGRYFQDFYFWPIKIIWPHDIVGNRQTPKNTLHDFQNCKNPKNWPKLQIFKIFFRNNKCCFDIILAKIQF